jgi:CRP/FNR family cyclic AMP-dependent transcriptional regulator
MKPYDILKEVPLFSCLDEQELRDVADIAVEKTFQKDTIIIHEGDTSTSMYVVLTGKAIAIAMNEADGKQLVLNMFEQGDYFGEMSFLDAEPRCATVKTREKTTFLVLSCDKFRNILTSTPDIYAKLMKGLLQKIRKATKQVEELAFHDVYKRVALLLKRLAISEDGKMIVRQKLTMKDIGEMVGASREMISKIMKELSDGGYISVHKQSILIHKSLPKNR